MISNRGNFFLETEDITDKWICLSFFKDTLFDMQALGSQSKSQLNQIAIAIWPNFALSKEVATRIYAGRGITSIRKLNTEPINEHRK